MTRTTQMSSIIKGAPEESRGREGEEVEVELRRRRKEKEEERIQRARPATDPASAAADYDERRLLGPMQFGLGQVGRVRHAVGTSTEVNAVAPASVSAIDERKEVPSESSSNLMTPMRGRTPWAYSNAAVASGTATT
eukprot:CAMPEP_0206463054 /NCGR_PEP_ID=MMETSP0324_2-20121206/26358_1 /ASSEMBLY_ACC=CAM_ASM_000836 /TAXON_ID=2866 /ORGANISM="Crypthecodinium cohnii, Strain Seligo" /LENGTH=136 /DNA_ID=CAMNT_0053935353 /DNA_START=55 /DNA_END=462 /DNA_ORIENTATION=+